MGSTPDPEFCPWPTPDLTPTAPSFSSVPPRPSGWTASTLSSDRSSREWRSLRRLNPMDPRVERLQRRLLLPTAVNAKLFVFRHPLFFISFSTVQPENYIFYVAFGIRIGGFFLNLVLIVISHLIMLRTIPMY